MGLARGLCGLSRKVNHPGGGRAGRVESPGISVAAVVSPRRSGEVGEITVVEVGPDPEGVETQAETAGISLERRGGRRPPDTYGGESSMAGSSAPIMQWSDENGVAVVEVLARELQGPEAAATLREQLESLLRSGETRLLLDFGRTRVMSSTAFGALLTLWKQMDAAGGELRICDMDPTVRFGADILRLGQYIPIHDDRASALAAFGRRPS
jgi:anti-sigma B factor antagonist